MSLVTRHSYLLCNLVAELVVGVMARVKQIPLEGRPAKIGARPGLTQGEVSWLEEEDVDDGDHGGTDDDDDDGSVSDSDSGHDDDFDFLTFEPKLV